MSVTEEDQTLLSQQQNLEVSCTQCCFWKQAKPKSYGILEYCTKFHKAAEIEQWVEGQISEGHSGVPFCQAVRVKYKAHWLPKEVGHARTLGCLPGEDICMKWRHSRREACAVGADLGEEAVPAQRSSDGTSPSSRGWTWSCGVYCLLCWVLVIL